MKTIKGKFNGFTLLEVLVSIAIFAAIVSVLYPSYTGTFKNIEYTESEAEIYHMARITLERLTKDIKSTYIPAWIEQNEENEDELIQRMNFFAEDEDINGRSADSLRFFFNNHLVFREEDRPGNAFISYYIKEREDDSLVLYRNDTHEFDEIPDEETGGLILCENLYSLEFTYFDENGDSYDDWDSSSDMFKGKLPVMVSIKLEFINGPDPEAVIRFMTSVSLPMASKRYGRIS
jgi:prepilin-type N-terminal cleavage/methylation domain-containing protein